MESESDPLVDGKNKTGKRTRQHTYIHLKLEMVSNFSRSEDSITNPSWWTIAVRRLERSFSLVIWKKKRFLSSRKSPHGFGVLNFQSCVRAWLFASRCAHTHTHTHPQILSVSHLKGARYIVSKSATWWRASAGWLRRFGFPPPWPAMGEWRKKKEEKTMGGWAMARCGRAARNFLAGGHRRRHTHRELESQRERGAFFETV